MQNKEETRKKKYEICYYLLPLKKNQQQPNNNKKPKSKQNKLTNKKNPTTPKVSSFTHTQHYYSMYVRWLYRLICLRVYLSPYTSAKIRKTSLKEGALFPLSSLL